MDKIGRSLAIAVVFLQISVVTVAGHEKGFVKRNSEGAGDEGCKKVITGITISPLVTQMPLRPLEVWWKCAKPVSGDWLGLFNVTPNTANLATALASVQINESSGWWVSNSPANIPDDDEYINICRYRWAAIISADNTTITGASCLKLEHIWMWNMKEDLWSLPITEVFIPGTHESGSTRRYTFTRPDEDRYEYKFAVTQEEIIRNQLMVGARYLDLRIGYYTSSTYTERWWIHHETCMMMTLRKVLSDVRDFVRLTKKIVVLDVHEVMYLKRGKMGNYVHDYLVKYIINMMSDYLTPPSLGWNATIGDVWASGKRVILSYNDIETVNRYQHILWSPISQKWGNAGNLEELHEYLKEVHENVTQGPWAAMAELTASFTDILFERKRSIRVMADTVNKNVSEWYYGPWGETANIVAVDFFRSTNIVDAAIMWNRRKSEKLKKKETETTTETSTDTTTGTETETATATETVTDANKE